MTIKFRDIIYKVSLYFFMASYIPLRAFSIFLGVKEIITVGQYITHRELVADNEVPFGSLKLALLDLIVRDKVWGKVICQRDDNQIVASFSDWQRVDNAIHLVAFMMRMEELGIGEVVLTPYEIYSGQTLRRDH